ncbi:hypothetical protein MRX96_032747 [Rhipicephalus microplus]
MESLRLLPPVMGLCTTWYNYGKDEDFRIWCARAHSFVRGRDGCLTDEWKAKYANTPVSAATEDSPTGAGEDAEALLHDLRKHLDSAKEAEQLVLSFQRLGQELGSGLHSRLEHLLAVYRELHSKMDAASALERYRGLCEQLCSGAQVDPASLQHQQDLQLKALRASLEEQHSQEKTALLSEQVVRTKELLSKHRAEVEQLERTAEARLVDERRRLTEELDPTLAGFNM